MKKIKVRIYFSTRGFAPKREKDSLYSFSSDLIALKKFSKEDALCFKSDNWQIFGLDLECLMVPIIFMRNMHKIRHTVNFRLTQLRKGF